MKNIWKYLIGLAVVAFFVGYVWFSRQSPGSSASNINPPSVATGSPSATTPAPSVTVPTPTGGTAGGTAAAGAGTGSGSSGAAGAYKDGTYTGTAADAFYGTVQVAAVIRAGALADVQLLQYPSDNGHSLQVSNGALPQLKQEAIAAQSANVNIISGATQTSQAFQQSLAAALAQAKS